jgi:hypothetical protein
LVDLYILILRFLAKALRVYENNSLGRAIAACWSSDDIQMFERECQGLETRAEIEAQNCERFLNSAERAMTAKMRKDLSKLSKLSDISDSLDHVDFLATEMWGKLQEEEMGTILRWVSEIPHEDDHKAARNGRTPGTGGWLFEHHKYRAWQSSERSEVFWIHGIREFTSYHAGLLTMQLTLCVQPVLAKLSSSPMSLINSLISGLTVLLLSSSVTGALVLVESQKTFCRASLSSWLDHHRMMSFNRY